MIRSMLFVPGNSPGMLLHADIHGADALIFDLEDAVASDQKDAARILVRNAIKAMRDKSCPLIVRMNPVNTIFADKDIEVIVALKPYAILAPKIDSAGMVQELSSKMAKVEIAHGLEVGSVKLITLLETALGIENAFSIASFDKRLCAVLLGAEDLTSDLRAKRSKPGLEIAYARGRVVSAARAANVDVYDTPFTDVFDDEGLIVDARLARELGFTGKASISPRHVRPINTIFSPSEEEIAYAEEVLAAIEDAEAAGRGAVSLRGKMIDKPVVDRARYVLEVARQLGGR